MTRSRSLFVRVAGLLTMIAPLLAVGCLGCGGKTYPRSYPEPTVQEVIDRLEGMREQAKSFQAESVMDYWLGDQRVKGSVLVMGKRGARLRLNALNPNGDQVAADLACDGIEFRYVDINNNCQMSGPCTGDSIAQLLHVSLEPDDFLLLAVGTTPVLHDATGTVTWDERTGQETVDLESGDGQLRQVIVFDGRDGHRDVLSSKMLDAKGNPTWILENKEFQSVKTVDGLTMRVPAKTRFQQPSSPEGKKADLLVDWKERSINPDLQAGKFDLPVPDGLRRCN